MVSPFWKDEYPGPWVLVITRDNDVAFQPELCAGKSEAFWSMNAWARFLIGAPLDKHPASRMETTLSDPVFDISGWHGELHVPRVWRYGSEDPFADGAPIEPMAALRWRAREPITATGVTLLSDWNDALRWGRHPALRWHDGRRTEYSVTHIRHEFKFKRGHGFSLACAVKVVNGLVPGSAAPTRASRSAPSTPPRRRQPAHA